MDDEARFAAATRKPGRPKGRVTGGYTVIDAPVEVVWGIAGDFQSWGEWNPLYIRTSGEPRVGNVIEMTVQVEGMPAMDAKATVVTNRDNACLEYSLRQMAGLLKAFRFIEVEEVAPGRTGLANGEITSGLLAGLIAAKVGPRVDAGLKAMNAKIKQLAEAKVAARPA